jgi:4'-phosphopantetheinyl transferase
MSNTSAGHSIFDLEPEGFERLHMPVENLALPAAGVIHAWFLNLFELAQALRGALDGHVGVDDAAAFTPGQLRFARRFFLRLLLGAYLGVPGKSVRINRSVRGKPMLDAAVHRQDLHFSMAKSGDRVLIGFSSGVHLGVDLEPAGRRAHRPLGVARRYFSVTESAALEALHPSRLNDAFLRTWACKEAVVKASGQGIANELCRFTVETDPDRPAAVLDFEGQAAAQWTLALLRPEEDFLGAVACPGPGMAVRAWRLLPARPAGAS